MLACVRTAAVFGIEAAPVQVEVDVSFGLPSFGNSTTNVAWPVSEASFGISPQTPDVPVSS